MSALRAKGRVTIEIDKQLPVQGGLGGASANAVACLLGLERALRKTLPAAERLRIAAEVGSDLPLFLIGGTVLGIGRGEQVYPLPDLPAIPCVVVTPEVGVSTPKAFAEWDRTRGLKPGFFGGSNAALKGRSSTVRQADVALEGGSSTVQNGGVGGSSCSSNSRDSDETMERRSQDSDPALKRRPSTMLQIDVESLSVESAEPKLTVSGGSDRMNELGRGLSAWLSEPYSSAPSSFMARRGRAGNPLLWLVRAGIENDFEQVVFPEYPELREGKRALERAGAKYASLSGSGSTLYGLFASKAAGVRAVARLRKQGWAARATTTLSRSVYWRRVTAG